MRRLFILLGLLVLAGPGSAQGNVFQGQWQVRVPDDPAYIGTMLIDTDGRATWDSPKDSGRPAKFIGYVARAADPKAHVVFTNRTVVSHMHCLVQSSDLLSCYFFREADRQHSVAFNLVRIGSGPRKLHAATPP